MFRGFFMVTCRQINGVKRPFSSKPPSTSDGKVVAAAPPFYPHVSREKIPKLFELEKVEENVYRANFHGEPKSFGDNIYGGLLSAQALNAAQSSVPDGFVPHSVHNYFVAFPSNQKPVDYKVIRIRDGRNLCTRFVNGVQNGKIVFTSSASFCQKEEPSIYHQLPMPEVAPPESLKNLYDVCRDNLKATDISKMGQKEIRRRLLDEEVAVFEVRPVEPDMQLMLRPYSPHKTMHNWMKSVINLGDNDLLHRAMVTFFSDTYLAGKIGWPHGSHDFVPDLVTSLDHSIWFHDYDFRADEWLLYETWTPVANSGRGLAHGRMWSRDGRLILSSAQETLTRAKTAKSRL